MQKKIFTVTEGKESITVPFLEFGNPDGKKGLFISGGVHGDEVNGVFAVKSVIELLVELENSGGIDGRVVVFPIMNPLGFSEGVRKVPLDNKDLNRQFGVSDPTTISQYFAKQLTEEILQNFTMGVDFHDAGGGAKLLPHTRIHLDDENDCISCSRELAGFFGLPYMLERKGRSSMMAVALNNEFDTPVITVEVGGSRELDSSISKIARKGVRNVLMANSIIDGVPDLPEETFVVYRRIVLKSKYSGVIQLKVKLGDRVAKDDLIGEIYDPISMKNVKILAPKSGVFFSHWPDNLITKGRAIGSFVCLNDDEAAEKVDMPAYLVESFNL